MDYRDVVFLTVAEYMSFSKAAENLCISQPAVTKHIKELEAKFKLNLFERKGNKIYLTHAGKTAYDYFKRIEQQYRDLDFEMSSLNQDSSGEIIIGASSTISQYVVPEVMASFYRRYPNIHIRLINGNSFNMEQLLLANKVDLALVENESSQTDITYSNFLDDELIVVAGAKCKCLRKAGITLNEFTELPLVLRENGSGTLEVIKRALLKHHLTIEQLNTVIHLGSTESIKNFLQNFEGIAVVSEKAVSAELQAQSLRRIHVEELAMLRKFRIALRRGHHSKLVSLFTNYLNRYNF